MEYIVLALEDESAFDSREDPHRAASYWETWSAYIDDLRSSGVLVSAGGLYPPGASTTVRLRDGQRLVQDGPFADTKEQLGGFFVIDVPDLDDAIEWAARCPSAAYASVEVRPLLPAMR